MNVACHIYQKNNANIERVNRDILDGTRTALVPAGTPGCFWPFAGPTYCHNDNIDVDKMATHHGARRTVRIFLVLASPLVRRWFTTLATAATKGESGMPVASLAFSQAISWRLEASGLANTLFGTLVRSTWFLSSLRLGSSSLHLGVHTLLRELSSPRTVTPLTSLYDHGTKTKTTH